MQTFPFSRRYLFGKKSTNAIHIISGVSILGISVGSAALILVMSVLNGFEGLIRGLFDSFNPDIKISLAEGKTFNFDSSVYNKLISLSNIDHLSTYLEETTLLEYKDNQDFASIKGVDTGYYAMTPILSKIVEGDFRLASPQGYETVVGQGLQNKLAISLDDDFASLSVYMPDKKSSPLTPFKRRSLKPVGVFSIQQDFDNKYLFADLGFVQELTDKPNQISGFEIKLKNYKIKNQTIKNIQTILGNEFKVEDRYQQDAAFYKLMKIEKWVSFAILCFILVLVAFNIIGALWMIVLEKKKDILVLKSMGMTAQAIRNIFMGAGVLITIIGILIGFILALVFYTLQQKYGLVPIPEGFVIDRYPIQIRISDFIIVAITVALIGISASILPSLKASKLEGSIRYE